MSAGHGIRSMAGGDGHPSSRPRRARPRRSRGTWGLHWRSVTPQASPLKRRGGSSSAAHLPASLYVIHKLRVGTGTGRATSKPCAYSEPVARRLVVCGSPIRQGTRSGGSAGLPCRSIITGEVTKPDMLSSACPPSRHIVCLTGDSGNASMIWVRL